jgi:hypothetical protein
VLGLDGERGGPPVLSRAGDGFGFDLPRDPRDARPESDGSLFLSGHSEDTLDFTGSFLQRDTVRFTFSFDLPDHLHVRRVWLLEQPAPVPGGFALLAVGLGALALRRRLQTPAPIARALRPIR